MHRGDGEALITEEADQLWGQEVLGKSQYLPLTFSVNLKLLRKMRPIKNIIESEGLTNIQGLPIKHTIVEIFTLKTI